MKKDFKYIVYKHTAPNNKIYIGITKNKPNRRWCKGLGYVHNQHFYRAINKYGWDNIKHEILLENLTKAEAEQKEKELIAFYKSNQENYGYNIESGGNATKTLSEETKRKISIAMIGKKGRYVTEEQKEMYRKNSKNNWINEEIKNKIMKKIINNHGVKVVCVETGKIYNTLTDAQKDTGASRQYIEFCCKDKNKTSGGYHWKYFNNIKTNDTTKYRKNNVINKRKISQYDLQGNFIKEYESITLASNETNTDISKIMRTLKGKITKSNKYIWKYSE